MADGRAAPDQKRKRGVRDDDEEDALPSFKKLQAAALNESDDFTQGGSSSSTSSIDSIFDFPWLKEGTKTSDWGLHEEDVFANSLNESIVVVAAAEAAANVEVEDHRLIAAGEWEMCAAGVEKRAGWFKDDDGSDGYDARIDEARDGADDDGLDCIWKSLLNQQPLSNIEY